MSGGGGGEGRGKRDEAPSRLVLELRVHTEDGLSVDAGYHFRFRRSAIMSLTDDTTLISESKQSLLAMRKLAPYKHKPVQCQRRQIFNHRLDDVTIGR